MSLPISGNGGDPKNLSNNDAGAGGHDGNDDVPWSLSNNVGVKGGANDGSNGGPGDDGSGNNFWDGLGEETGSLK